MKYTIYNGDFPKFCEEGDELEILSKGSTFVLRDGKWEPAASDTQTVECEACVVHYDDEPTPVAAPKKTTKKTKK